MLKGKIISITENITGYRMSILNEARVKFGFKNVRIPYKDNNDGQKIKSLMNRIYFKTLVVTIKMGKNHVVYLLLFRFFLFSVIGV